MIIKIDTNRIWLIKSKEKKYHVWLHTLKNVIILYENQVKIKWNLTKKN
jgi:hypothetical protein